MISEITAEFAAETLKVENKENKITCDYIINIVAEHFQISPADICSKKKSKEIACPRQSMYVSVQKFILMRNYQL